MPGKVSVQENDLTPRDQQQVRAYCEGRQASKDGGTLGDVPHPSGSPNAYWWELGHASWSENPAGKNTRDACCLPFGGGGGTPPADGILFDTARGDSFVGNFVATPSSGAVITATSITLDSDTPVNVDILLQNAGEDVSQCFENWFIEIEYDLTGPFGGAGVPGVLTGYKNELASWSGIMDQGHGGSGGGTVLPTKWLQNGAAGYGTGGKTIGAGIPCSNKVAFVNGTIELDGTYDGDVLLNDVITLQFTEGTNEAPRLFNKIGINFLGGHAVIKSIKVYVANPNAKYALVGDSITQGRFASSFAESWSLLFSADNPNEVIICAAPAAKIVDWTAANVAVVAKSKPKYAIVMLGTNDIVEPTIPLSEVKSTYITLISEIESHGIIPIVVGVPPNGRPDTPDFVAWLQATYPKYINCYTPLLGTGVDMNAAYDSGDDVHPNSAGHALIASTILGAITSSGWN